MREAGQVFPIGKYVRSSAMSRAKHLHYARVTFFALAVVVQGKMPRPTKAYRGRAVPPPDVAA